MTWKLQDLVNIPNLQMLMDRFYDATHIPVGIISCDGEILVATGWQTICTQFHRTHPVTAERCRQSDDYIKTRLTSKNPVEYKCQNGLWDVAVPIIIADEHVATLFLGQFFYEDEKIDEEFYRRQAEEFGFDLTLYMEALRRIPVYSREKVRQILDFYTPFVNFLVSTGLANHQRAEAEKALRESEEKFARTFRFTPSALSISTVAEGRYVEVNDTFEQCLGYARGEVVGRNALELGIWDSPETLNQLVQAVLEKGEVRGVEGRLRSKSGKTLVGLLSAEVIEIKEELCLLTLVNDITERKRLEGEIEILNTELAARAFELETANRELESFNYTVSHDLRRHITVISGYSNLLMELFSTSLSEQALGYLKEVDSSTQKMEQLIETLMSFALLSRSEMTRTTVDLTELAKRINWSLRLSDAGREVSFTVAEALSVNGDAKLLEIVLENLLGNAWKYSSKRDTAKIEFGSTSIEGETVFFVRDNGEGFDMAHAEKLFCPFERLPGTQDIPGHGIGLATVQRIIQRHGGQVWAQSEPGEGATFYFKL